MKYIIVEIQVNSDGTVGNIVQTADSRYQAESIYHTVLASAAISSVRIHSCVLLTQEGKLVMSESYAHGDEVD